MLAERDGSAPVEDARGEALEDLLSASELDHTDVAEGDDRMTATDLPTLVDQPHPLEAATVDVDTTDRSPMLDIVSFADVTDLTDVTPRDLVTSVDSAPTCAAPRRLCGGECVDPMVDAHHCGACDRPCNNVNGSASCAAGRCTLQCNPPFADCDGDGANGCERYTTTDPSHCGACGRACAAGELCAAGVCRAGQRSCLGASLPGCGLVEVTGGTFSMGGDSQARNGGTVQPNVTVGRFAVDSYEVTVARYRQYQMVRTADRPWVRGNPVAYPGGQRVTWDGPGSRLSGNSCNYTEPAGARERHPANCVDIWAALEFCVWDGGRLPTTAEWEWLARGRAVPGEGLMPGRTYAWGEATPSASCDRARWNYTRCAGEDGGDTRRVGSFAPSGGLYDLTGNVWEWVMDHHANFGRAPCWAGASARDPLCVLSATSDRELRGGGWDDLPVTYLRGATRMTVSPSLKDQYTGFRCVRTR